MELIQAGKYVARVSNWALIPGKDGEAPKVQLGFVFKDSNGAEQSIRWRGSLKEGKPRNFTIKTLLTCGLWGDDLALLADSTVDALDRNREVQIEVENRLGLDGKTYANVKWVNAMGGDKFRALAADEAKSLLGGLNLKADILAVASNLGVNLTSAEKAEDLPF